MGQSIKYIRMRGEKCGLAKAYASVHGRGVAESVSIIFTTVKIGTCKKSTSSSNRKIRSITKSIVNAIRVYLRPYRLFLSIYNCGT